MPGRIGLLLALLATTRGAAAGELDPWPEFQRTASRTGRTSTIGPQTARLHWQIQYDFSELEGGGAGTVLDAEGRIFAPGAFGLTCIDSHDRIILWEFVIQDSAGRAPVLHAGRVLFGSANGMFYCLDAASGEELWSASSLPHPNLGAVADESIRGGVVYYPTQLDVAYARKIDDGELVGLRRLPTVSCAVRPWTVRARCSSGAQRAT